MSVFWEYFPHHSIGDLKYYRRLSLPVHWQNLNKMKGNSKIISQKESLAGHLLSKALFPSKRTRMPVDYLHCNLLCNVVAAGDVMGFPSRFSRSGYCIFCQNGRSQKWHQNGCSHFLDGDTGLFSFGSDSEHHNIGNLKIKTVDI